MEEATVGRLDAKVSMLASRCVNENCVGGPLENAHKMIEYDTGDSKEDDGAPESLSAAESKDVLGTGRPLTKRESQEMVRLRTHDLYGYFVAMVT